MKDHHKFRAFCLTIGEMYKYSVPTLDGKKVNVSDNSDGTDNRFLDADKCILESCTGLKDKNGVLMYEGDIVEFYDAFDEVHSGSPQVIEFDDVGDFYGKGYQIYSSDCLIIGTVNQNPELLK